VIQDPQNYPNLPVFKVSKKDDVKTLAIAALFRGNELIGALISAFTQKPKILPEDEIALLRGLADQASSAIENAELFEQVRAGRERQRKLAKSLVDIQEAERRRIAKELHDHLGQILTGLQFMLETTKNQASGTQRSNLEEIQNAVSDIIREVREMSLNLRPSMLDDMGLLPTLLWHLDRYTSQTGIRVNFQYDEFPKRLPLEIETAAYRIIQEALTNVARYAQVDEVFVGLVILEKTLWVEVLDKGKGFPTSTELDRPSSGLSGMRERASLVGGYLVVESFINQGTQIVAALPLTEQPLERRKYDRNRAPS
jgi:signal transduction histidine kinase